jgi:hypothetical protein
VPIIICLARLWLALQLQLNLVNLDMDALSERSGSTYTSGKAASSSQAAAAAVAVAAADATATSSDASSSSAAGGSAAADKGDRTVPPRSSGSGRTGSRPPVRKAPSRTASSLICYRINEDHREEGQEAEAGGEGGEGSTGRASRREGRWATDTDDVLSVGGGTDGGGSEMNFSFCSSTFSPVAVQPGCSKFTGTFGLKIAY